MEHPLRPVVANWLEKIKLGLKVRWEQFGENAAEAMRFYNGPYRWMYDDAGREGGGMRVGDDEDGVSTPNFRVSINKVAEMVQLFGPVLYHKNPIRTVTGRTYPQLPAEMFADPSNPQLSAALVEQVRSQNMIAAQFSTARAKLLAHYLNYTPYELGLKDQARLAIDEAIIKGMGTLWPEVETLGNNLKAVGSFYVSVDDLVIDPDAKTMRDVKWIARRCCHPTWQVEREYGFAPGSVKGNKESWGSYAEHDPDGDKMYARRQGHTADLLSYWKIYSKMGVGGRLQGAPESYREILDSYGDYCLIVVADSIPFPLNVPPWLLQSADDSQVARAFSWPVPFWADGAWPYTEFSFHHVPGQCWPMSHLAPGMGELKFINWSFSFMMGKIQTTCRDFLAVAKRLGPDVRKKILSGRDLTLIELEEYQGKINDAVQFLQHPPMNKDLWTVTEAVIQMFEKRTGLSELLYGESAHQHRSATESEVKQSMARIRPDDMQNKVEEQMTEVSKKEAVMARYTLTAADVQPVLGPAGALAWQRWVSTSTLEQIGTQLEYRIEAGSTRKPNRERQAANMGQAMQNLFQPLLNFAMTTGNFGYVNALLTDWADSIDLDASKYLVQPPPPPPPPAPGQQEQTPNASPRGPAQGSAAGANGQPQPAGR